MLLMHLEGGSSCTSKGGSSCTSKGGSSCISKGGSSCTSKGGSYCTSKGGSSMPLYALANDASTAFATFLPPRIINNKYIASSVDAFFRSILEVSCT